MTAGPAADRPGRPASLSDDTAARLDAAGLEATYVLDVVTRAIEEDLDGGLDVTSVATVPADQVSTADLVARADGVVAGLPVAAAVFDVATDRTVQVTWLVEDGARVRRGDVLMSLTARTRGLLTGERTALNLLCRLSGIATLTRQWADAVDGTGAAVRDTRKTTPGLRVLEKYAVRCGGGVNHRMSLSDAAMVKDNHVVAAGGVAEAFRAVRAAFPDVPVEVEGDSVAMRQCSTRSVPSKRPRTVCVLPTSIASSIRAPPSGRRRCPGSGPSGSARRPR